MPPKKRTRRDDDDSSDGTEVDRQRAFDRRLQQEYDVDNLFYVPRAGDRNVSSNSNHNIQS